MKKVLITMTLVVLSCLVVNAQQDHRSMFRSPEKHEKVLGSVVLFLDGTFYKDSDPKHYENGYSDQEISSAIIKKAKQEFPNYTNLIIRNLDIKYDRNYIERKGYYVGKTYSYTCFFSVVVADSRIKFNLNLDQAVSKALIKVPSGARMAIDNISTSGASNNEAIKDQLLDLLIDKGYRVVAKEYLERLYREQQDQQSGIYNERTTVQENNFSAVGYFINVKVTETSIRVQVVNVSTGEYEGNTTVNF